MLSVIMYLSTNNLQCHMNCAKPDRAGNFMDRINQQSADVVSAMLSAPDRKRALEDEMALERPDKVFAVPRPPAKALALTDQLTGKPVRAKQPQRSKSIEDVLKARMQAGRFCDMQVAIFQSKVGCRSSCHFKT